MIGVVVPAHNEAFALPSCLTALQEAAQHAFLYGERVEIVLVLDACTDESEAVARQYGITVLTTDARNVGVARATGADHCLGLGARWLAFTDADTCVASDWLPKQLEQRCDAVCGTVAIRDWGVYGQAMQAHFASSYTDRDGHAHIHGANMGVSAEAYVRAGGFTSLACSEDVALVEALKTTGATIAWSASPRVFTSARQDFRAAGGFGDTLLRIHTQAQTAPVCSAE